MTSHDISKLVEFEPANDEQPSNGRRHGPSNDGIDPSARRWPWLALGIVIGIGATLAISSFGGEEAVSDEQPQEVVELATMTVESRDLIESVEWTGTLAVGTAVAVDATTTGVVTEAAAAGALIERGDTIAVVGSEPVIALYGTVPMWRDLSEGDAGADVLQLEMNLVALGFDPDGTLTIDNEYTSSTATMVESWQESIGAEVTGEVSRANVAVLGGPSTVAEPAIVGSTTHPDAQLATAETLSQFRDIAGAHSVSDTELPGVVTLLAEVGTQIEHGTVVYEVDDIAVSAVLVVDVVTEAVLASFETADIEQIENVLAYLGFDPDGAIVADDESDPATVAAVMRWQESVGLAATGSINPRDYVVIPDAGDAAYVVSTHHVEVGTPLGEGRVVISVASPTRSVTADVAISEIGEFAVGDQARAVQLDESEFDVVVTEISDVAAGTTAGQNSEPTVAVTFEIVTEPDVLVAGSLTIVTESSRIDDAVVVPTRALVTLREGGFAVEIADPDGSTHLVGVELGVFDDGWVEITNDAVAPGTDVVVPT